MNRLQQIRFADGSPGFQEVSADGRLLRLYDDDGEQRARMADADRYPRVTFTFVRDLGPFGDADDFWRLVASATERPHA